MKIKHIIPIIASAFIIISCNQKKTYSETSEEEISESVEIKYARGFSIEDFDKYKRVTVFNPWGKKDEIQARYYLVTEKNTEIPKDGVKVEIPLQRVASSSCTHYEFISILNELKSLKGICNPELAYNASIRNGVNDGSISSLGDAFSPDIEKLLALKPDGYLLASYNQNDNTNATLQQTGITLVYNNEWVEETVLGRAEWIKFVAAFFNKSHLADSLFAEIETRYIDAKKLTASVKHKPTIMAGSNFKGTWYMPSGRSYMGGLFADAGASYRFAQDTTVGSIPLSFEQVLMNFHDSDVWLNAPTETISELVAMDERHRDFRPLRNGMVFAFLGRHDGSANDFWESAVAHPDLVLKDLIWALHPNILANYQPTYIIKLK